ncbi:TonB-dependent receptor [bacterium]|nr:TonB-dependent receptor [bacterium]
MFFSNFLLEHRLSPSRSLSLDVGGSQGHVRRVFIDDLTKSQISSSYVKFNCLLDALSIQAFWNRIDQEEKSVYLTSPDERINSNTVDLELQYKKNLKWNNSLVSGASIRHNSFSTDVTPADEEQDLYSFYLQDEYRPIPELSFLAGCRVDHHPLTKTNVSPRFSLICAPDRVNTLRISLARAYRNPSFQNSELDYKRSYRLHVLGNRELKAEKATSTEFGYTFFPGEMMKFKTDLFFLRFHDNIFLEKARQEGDFLVLTFNNRDKARIIWGFESSLDFIPVPCLKFNLNYSFQRVGNDYFVGAQQSPPRDKANCKVSLSPAAGVDLSLNAGYTSGSKWIVVDRDGEFGLYKVPAHSTVDTRLGYSAGDSGLELFVAGYNLFDNKVREYPVAERIRRRVTVGAYWTY